VSAADETRTDLLRLRQSEHAQRVTIKTLIERPGTHSKLRELREEDFTLTLCARALRAAREMIVKGRAVDFFNVTAAAGFTDPERVAFSLIMDEAYREEDLGAHVATIRGYSWRTTLAQRLESAKAAALDGVDHDTLINVLDDLRVSQPRRRAEPVDIHSEGIVAEQPHWYVDGLFRHRGLQMIWGDPFAGKTWALFTWLHEMLTRKTGCLLSGHPYLEIREGWNRSLWITSEEDAGTMRAMSAMVCRGLGVDPPDGRLFHLFAADPRSPFKIEALPDILDADGPFDAVFLDPVVAMLPNDGTKWDGDNPAVSDVCLRLRGLASEHEASITLIHHTGRDRKDFRGVQSWLSSVDVMAGIIAEEGDGAIMVKPQKARGLKLPRPFRMSRSWGPDGYRMTYEGAAIPKDEEIVASVGLAFRHKDVMDAMRAELGLSPDAAKKRASRCLKSMEKKGQLALADGIYRRRGGDTEGTDSGT